MIVDYDEALPSAFDGYVELKTPEAIEVLGILVGYWEQQRCSFAVSSNSRPGRKKIWLSGTTAMVLRRHKGQEWLDREVKRP